MNVQRRLFVNACQDLKAAPLMATAVAAILLSGCASDPHGRAQLDPQSPIAGDVTRILNEARNEQDFPAFSEIPLKPGDVRPARAFGRAAAQVEQARADLERNTAPGTWTLSATESFAATAQRDAGPQVAPPTQADTDAFARELRRRATPPPPPKR